ncbi:uncharacterized protein LOC118565480 [Fundulus heteroclitus]|uniref:uncharacterized protein LOC118565480 n=1 Tax=Fundulus heteroclitus TaxID=8078 RepID=UPI00165A2F31|nr:uncharacterized protein LOC118565480 [Fundulus heteroclitus]
MTCRLGLRILLLCLLQAELGCSIITEHGPRLLNTRRRVALPDGRLSKFSSNLQGQLRKSFPQHQMQTSSFRADPAHGQKLSTSGKKQRGPTNAGRKDPAKQGAVRAQRDSYSFRRPYQSAALEPTFYGQKSSASLFGPVAPGPRSSVRMQTYAQAPARRVSPGRTKGAKARSLSSQTAVGKSYLSPELALNVGGYRPRSSRVGESAPGFAPTPRVTVGLKSPTDHL